MDAADGAGAVEFEVVVSRGEKGKAAAENVAVNGFADLHGTDFVEAIGEGAGEAGWDVLGDDDGRHVGGQTK
jgi:hypothetical protein